MTICFPLIALFLLFLISYQKEHCWRSSILTAAITWGVLLTAITEILSFFQLVTFRWILGAWGLSCLMLILQYWYALKKQRFANTAKKEKSSISSTWRVVLLGIACVITLVGLTAVVAPPNNWDSMTYHMARVMHWIQNHSVAHFPTNYTPQLFLSPWSEFAILHLQILSGGDHYANLVQWFCMVGSVIGVSLLAKHLGATLPGQILAAAVCAAIPVGILEGSSTQNDYVTSFWIVCLVHYILVSTQNRESKAYGIEIGTSLGLACLSKGTAYIYAAPLLFWFFISKIKLIRLQVWKPILQIVIVTILINVCHLTRNLKLFGSLFTDPNYKNYKNEIVNLSVLISNIVRNLALHLATPVPSMNHMVEQGVKLLHSFLHIDVSDPRTTWVRFQLKVSVNHEDSGSNFLHLILIIISIACFFICKKTNRKWSGLYSYLSAVIGGFLLFCLLLQWTPFHSRLHLPFFVLFSVFIGTVISRFWKEKIAAALAITLLISSLPWVFLNESRPLILNSNFVKSGKVQNIFNTERVDQYFSNNPSLKEVFLEGANFTNSKTCSAIGLALEGEPFEYPLWILFKKNKNQTLWIEHVDVKNVSAAKANMYPYRNFVPCAVLDNHAGRQAISVQQNSYIRQWNRSSLKILVKEEGRSS